MGETTLQNWIGWEQDKSTILRTRDVSLVFASREKTWEIVERATVEGVPLIMPRLQPTRLTVVITEEEIEFIP